MKYFRYTNYGMAAYFWQRFFRLDTLWLAKQLDSREDIVRVIVTEVVNSAFGLLPGCRRGGGGGGGIPVSRKPPWSPKSILIILYVHKRLIETSKVLLY